MVGLIGFVNMSPRLHAQFNKPAPCSPICVSLFLCYFMHGQITLAFSAQSFAECAQYVIVLVLVPGDKYMNPQRSNIKMYLSSRIAPGLNIALLAQ